MNRRQRRKEQRKKAFMTWFLVIVMVFSVAGILIGSTAPSQGTALDLDYGKYDFVRDGYGNYVVRINKVDRRFAFHPVDTLSFDFPEEAIRTLKASPVITVTFDPYSTDVENAEVSRFQLGANVDKVIYSGVTQNHSDYPDYPIIKCADASAQFPILFLNKSNQTGITYDNGCTVISAVGVKLIQGTERIIYEMLGVMDE